VPGSILAIATNDNSPGGSILTFAFPMGLFIVVASILYLLFSRPHRVPGHQTLAPAGGAGPSGSGPWGSGGASGEGAVPGGAISPQGSTAGGAGGSSPEAVSSAGGAGGSSPQAEASTLSPPESAASAEAVGAGKTGGAGEEPAMVGDAASEQETSAKEEGE